MVLLPQLQSKLKLELALIEKWVDTIFLCATTVFSVSPVNICVEPPQRQREHRGYTETFRRRLFRQGYLNSKLRAFRRLQLVQSSTFRLLSH